eukprot:466916_1
MAFYHLLINHNKVCAENKKSFFMINQKGIDPLLLDLLQKNGIVGIRRAKRRNMERLGLACGGYAVNSLHSLDESCLGHADLVYEHVLGEDKYTFVEGVEHPFSCTILIKGPNKHTIAQIKDAMRDGLRAINHALEDGLVIPGAGAFEVAYNLRLCEFKKSVKGRANLGVQAVADAMLVIPKVLAENSGLDAQAAIITLLAAPPPQCPPTKPRASWPTGEPKSKRPICERTGSFTELVPRQFFLR